MRVKGETIVVAIDLAIAEFIKSWLNFFALPVLLSTLFSFSTIRKNIPPPKKFL